MPTTDINGITATPQVVVLTDELHLQRTGGGASVKSTIQKVKDAINPAGAMGNATNPMTSFDLSGIELKPFAANSISVNAISDVTNYVGLLRTCTISTISIPYGLTAGMFARIGGVEYNVIGASPSGTLVTLEWDSKLKVDPVGTAVIFSEWEFKGSHAGKELFTRTTRRAYRHALTQQLHVMPAGFPCFQKAKNGKVGLSFQGASDNYSTQALNVGIAGGIVTLNASLGYDGLMSMAEFKENAFNSNHQRAVSITSVAGKTTWSVDLKAGTSGLVTLFNANGTDGTVGQANFDLVAGAITFVSPASDDAKIESLGSGIYRCSLTSTTTVVNSAYYIRDARLGAGVYLGDGVSTFFYSNPQLETIEFPSSHILNTGIVTNRALDSLKFPFINNKSNLADESTIMIEFDAQQTIAMLQGIYKVGALFNRFYLTGNDLFMQNGTNRATILAGFNDNLTHKIVETYSLDGISRRYLDGVLINQSNDTVYSVGIADLIEIGGGTGSLFGNVIRADFYASALSAAEVASL